MPTTIAHTAKETISRLIRKEFDSIDKSMDYIYGKADKLIHTARTYQLDDLADEMANDLR